MEIVGLAANSTPKSWRRQHKDARENDLSG